MAVGAAGSYTSGSQSSVASFNITTTPASCRAGLVYVVTYANSGAAIDSAASWNGAAMTFIGYGADTDTEPARVRMYFLDNVSSGNVTITRTNNTVVCVGYAIAVSASGQVEIYQWKSEGGSSANTGADTSGTGTAASGEVALDDNSPGTDSMRFACYYTGAATPLAAGTNSTQLQSHDVTAYGSAIYRETTAGQGSRSVGPATGTTDDRAAVYAAIREVPPPTYGGPWGRKDRLWLPRYLADPGW